MSELGMDRDRIAYHEAGHAVAMYVLGHSFQQLWIADEEGAVEVSGRFRFAKRQDLSFGAALNYAMIALAGHFAEGLSQPIRGCLRKRKSVLFVEDDHDWRVVNDILLEPFGGSRAASYHALSAFVQAKTKQMIWEPSISDAVHLLAKHLLEKRRLSRNAAIGMMRQIIAQESLLELRLAYKYR